MRYRNFLLVTSAASAVSLYAVSGLSQNVARRISEPRSPALSDNSSPPGKSDTTKNKIIEPIPLTAKAKATALQGIDQHLKNEAEQFEAKLRDKLPDELSVLAKTTGWKPEHQNALTAALRSGDPTKVFEAWAQGSPNDNTGAEMVARQVDVRRNFGRLEQNIEKGMSADQELKELETSLSKLGAVSPEAAELSSAIEPLTKWIGVRKVVESAIADAGPIAKLPAGKVTLIHDSSLPFGSAVVLGPDAVMVGNERRGPTTISKGNAAEAVGLPIVLGHPVPASESAEMTEGVLIANQNETGGNLRYLVNGMEYFIEPGMSQRLPVGRTWRVGFDRGNGFGVASYTLTPGTYYFTPTDQGWELYKQRFDVVLDNSQNPQPFNFLLYNEKLMVPQHQTRTIRSLYPMVIQFDRGNNTEMALRTLNFSGTAEIAINAEDNLWDVFIAEDGAKQKTDLKLFQAGG